MLRLGLVGGQSRGTERICIPSHQRQLWASLCQHQHSHFLLFLPPIRLKATTVVGLRPTWSQEGRTHFCHACLSTTSSVLGQLLRA